MKKLFFIIATFFAFGMFGAGNAYALKVDPAMVSVSLNPGESRTVSVTLMNDEKTPVTIQPRMFAATAGSNEKGFPAYTPATREDTLAQWITIGDSRDIIVKADEEKKVDLMISLPQDAAPGGHYAAIGWGVLSDSVTGGQVSIRGQIMTNIALDIPGAVFEKGDIENFSTKDKRTTYDRLPIDFSIRISNAGNRHFKPTGNVLIADMFGRAVATLPVNDGIGGGNVLPQSTREFTVTWKEGFAFGKYSATANLALGTAGSVSTTSGLWVLPATLLALWGFGALIIIVMIVLAVRSMMKKKKKNSVIV